MVLRQVCVFQTNKVELCVMDRHGTFIVVLASKRESSALSERGESDYDDQTDSTCSPHAAIMPEQALPGGGSPVLSTSGRRSQPHQHTAFSDEQTENVC